MYRSIITARAEIPKKEIMYYEGNEFRKKERKKERITEEKYITKKSQMKVIVNEGDNC